MNTDTQTNETAPVANPEDYIPTGQFNPHHIRPWIMGNEYGALAIAYASHEQDAFDIAADADLLKGLALDAETVEERESKHEGEGVMRLGNASEPFDSIYAWIRELPNKAPSDYASEPDKSAPHYDYNLQCWIEAGRVAKCGHKSKQTGCYACAHVGEVVNRDEHGKHKLGFNLVNYRLPSYWASYLLNNDASGLDAEDKAKADAFLKEHDLPFPVSVGESYIGRHDGLMCDVSDYTFLI